MNAKPVELFRGELPRGARRYDEVRTTTLEAALARENISQVDLLKVDCEGCEYELFEELQAKPWLTARIRRVAGELHGCSRHAWLTPKQQPPEAQVRACRSSFAFVKKTWPGRHRFIQV